jgi:hypothetical protein
VPLKTPIFNDSETSNILSRYPVELKQVFFEYLDFKSIKKLMQCNKKAAHFTVPIIAQRLASFNPHFAFDDELVNSLLLAILDKHFPKSKNLQSETIHDELQLLIFKYYNNGLNFDSIPKNIYFYLISFINEAVYGVDAIFDGSIQHFCVLLLKFKVPESLKYFRKFFADLFFKYPVNSPWEEHLKLFSQNPSKEEIRRHFEIPADINDWIKPRQIDDEFNRVVLELFYDEFTDENVVKFYDAFDMNYYVFSKAFTRRYFSIIDEDELMRAHNDLFTSNINREIICNEIVVRFGNTIETCYFSTRNSLNELSLDRLASFDSETIIEQLKLYSHSKSRICDFELIVAVMNSDLITPKLRLQVLEYFIHRYSYDIFELLTKESTRPMLYFLSPPDGTSIHRAIYPLSWIMFLEFLHSISDPIICLISLLSGVIPDSQLIHEIISEKVHKNLMDLNKIYNIEIELKSPINEFNGRTMHFKQILKELNNPKLNDAFRFNSTDLNHDYSTIDESLPIVIFDKDYMFTLNSH